MTRIIAVSNQKGGVGKTTSTINLATALAACEKKVLVVDFDPQGNATTGFGINKINNGQNVYGVIMGQCNVEDAIYETAVPGLSILPSTVHLSGAEIELVPALRREYKLQDALNRVAGKFDYVFIDCPPSLGLLTINALAAAKEVLVPLQTEFFAMEGISQLLKTVEIVRKNLNPELALMGVLLTMFDSRNKLSGLVEEDVRAYFGPMVFNTMIPRNVRVSEAPSHGKPVLIYDTACAGSLAYMKLAAEILRNDRPLDGQHDERIAA